MNQINPIAETADSVTLRREDFETLLAAAEDAIDHAAIDAQERREAALGKQAARADFLPGPMVDRLLAGESPARIWREHRGITARQLAAEAGVSVSYLSEIETRRKPGSPTALRAVARVLRVSLDDLVAG